MDYKVKRGLFPYCIGSVIISSTFLLVSSSCVSVSISRNEGTVEVSFQEPDQVKEIKERWKQYRPRRLAQTLFVETPSVKAPFSPGKLADTALLDGLNTTKFVRYLVGLSENVYLDEALVDQAQHGAVLLAAARKLTHTPARPPSMKQDFFARGYRSTTTSNIHQSVGTVASLSDAVVSFCDDSDCGNISRVGHRRWILNPTLGKIGFGVAAVPSDPVEAYVTMQVFDTSGDPATKHPFIAWPSPGYFPSSFFGPNQAWSISLDGARYDLRKSIPVVKLTRSSDNREWVFSSKDRDKNGKYYNIEKSKIGLPYCIIFRPDQPIDMLFSKSYRVEVIGLFDISGIPAKIEYEVKFFTLL